MAPGFRPNLNIQAARRNALSFAVASCFASHIFVAHANPTGAQVINGSAAFNQVGKTLNITNSPGAIINWQGFSIGADEVTRFIQSGANSAVLNRVIGGGGFQHPGPVAFQWPGFSA